MSSQAMDSRSRITTINLLIAEVDDPLRHGPLRTSDLIFPLEGMENDRVAFDPQHLEAFTSVPRELNSNNL